MITRIENETMVVTRQVDHAQQSGVLAARWGNDRFAEPAFQESVVYACGQHDEAWRHLDEAPILDPSTGQLIPFLSMPLDLILPAYLDGADRVGAKDPFAGFLVMMHYQGFFNRRFGMDDFLPGRTIAAEEEERVRAFMAAGEMLRGILRAKAAARGMGSMGHALTPSIVQAYLILQVVDVISLFLCLRPEGTWPLGEVARTAGGERVPISMRNVGSGRVVVEPWPFRGSEPILLKFPVRRIGVGRPYASTEALRKTLAAASEGNIEFFVSPAN